MKRRFLFLCLVTILAPMFGCGATTGKIKVTVEGQRISFFGRVKFQTRQATLDPRSHRVLDAIAEAIKDRPAIEKVEIAGHTDNRGRSADNLRLSQQRAEAVRNYLISKGISPDRLAAKGYGETRPIARNKYRSGRRKNRRVEFIIKRRSSK